MQVVPKISPAYRTYSRIDVDKNPLDNLCDITVDNVGERQSYIHLLKVSAKVREKKMARQKIHRMIEFLLRGRRRGRGRSR